ncbi:putative FecR domain-containing protein [Gammaproteobacteria bacterium]
MFIGKANLAKGLAVFCAMLLAIPVAQGAGDRSRHRKSSARTVQQYRDTASKRSLASADLNSKSAVVESISGKVDVNGVPAVMGTRLGRGAWIETSSNSQVVVRFQDGQVVGLKANSAMKVDRYQYNERDAAGSHSVLTLIRGGFRALSGALAKASPKNVEYRFPSGTIGVRGTEFMTSMVGDKAFAQTLSGSVQVSTAAGQVAVGVGETVAVSGTGSIATGAAAAAQAAQAGAFSGLNTMGLGAGSVGAVGSGVGTTVAGASTAATATGVAAGSAAMGAATIGIVGVGVAAGVAAVVGATNNGGGTTTQHSTTSHH